MQIFARVVLCLLVTSSFPTAICFSQERVAQERIGQEQELQDRIPQIRSIGDSAKVAVSNSPSIKASISAFQIQRSRLDSIESAFLPQVSVALGIGREDSNNSSTRVITGQGSDEMERRESSVFVSQMLFDGFKTHWQRESQLDEVSASELGVRHLASEVALKAIEAHLNVAQSNEVLNDSIENLQAHERIAKGIGIRVRSGKDDRAKISQISARLSLSLANVEADYNFKRILQMGCTIDFLHNTAEHAKHSFCSC